MVFLLFLSFLSFSDSQKVFDESEVACSKKEIVKNCSLVLVGSRSDSWVGYILLSRRGLKQDINEYVKNPEKFKEKIKKIAIEKIYKKKSKLVSLAGHLGFNQQSHRWTGYIEAQFEKSDEVVKTEINLDRIYD